MKKALSLVFTISALIVMSIALGVFAYAQPSMKFSDIVVTYKTARLAMPGSEIQYQETLKAESTRFENAQFALNEIYTSDADTLATEKKRCGTSLRCLASLNDEGKQLVNEHIQALESLKNTYVERKSQLDGARRGFRKMEMRVDPSLNQPPKPIKVHEKRIDPALINGRKPGYKN